MSSPSVNLSIPSTILPPPTTNPNDVMEATYPCMYDPVNINKYKKSNPYKTCDIIIDYVACACPIPPKQLALSITDGWHKGSGSGENNEPHPIIVDPP